MVWTGPVGVRRRGGAGRGWWFSAFSGGERLPPLELNWGSLVEVEAPFDGLAEVLECWLCGFVAKDGKTGVVGLEGGDSWAFPLPCSEPG